MTRTQRAVISIGLAAMCAVTFGSARPAARAPVSVPEYQVKGTYLFNFLRLVDWPSAGVPGGWALPVCVLGDSPITGPLEALASTPVRGRRMVVRRIDSTDDAGGCPVLFISGALADLDGIIQAVPGSVLTVSEINTDERVGSVINFAVDGERVVFDVNVEAATRARLSVSARLLSVARAVDGRKRRRD